jgi:hypothetical protein
MKLLSAVAFVTAASVAVAAQSPSYRAPRTPDGQPDLQGFWSNATYTPLERPDNVTKAFYTPEEAQAAEKRAAAAESAQTEPGTVADVHYDFTQFGLDRSQAARARNLRTSLIVDPPNGKLPPVTAEGKRILAARAAGRPLGFRAEQSARRPLRHHGGRGAADDGCRLQQQLSHRAGAWVRDDTHRNDSRRPHHPAGWAPAAV